MVDDVICLQRPPAVKHFCMLLDCGKEREVFFCICCFSQKKKEVGQCITVLEEKELNYFSPANSNSWCVTPLSLFRNPSGFSWDLSSLCLVLASKADSPLSYSVSHSETPSLDWLFTSSSPTQSLTSFYPHLLFFIAFNTIFLFNLQYIEQDLALAGTQENIYWIGKFIENLRSHEFCSYSSFDVRCDWMTYFDQ